MNSRIRLLLLLGFLVVSLIARLLLVSGSSENHTPPPPEQTIKDIENNPKIPARVKPMVLAIARARQQGAERQPAATAAEKNGGAR